jgi:hypothetical protein
MLVKYHTGAQSCSVCNHSAAVECELLQMPAYASTAYKTGKADLDRLAHQHGGLNNMHQHICKVLPAAITEALLDDAG